MSITNEDILAMLTFPVDPGVLVQCLNDQWLYDEVIEALQVAVERDVIMLDADGRVVPHDGEFYYA